MALLAALMLALVASASPAAAQSAEDPIRLGMLVPYPTGDSAVPLRLASEWLSAVRVAIQVLGQKYGDKFQVEFIVQNSDCSYESAKESAQVLVDEKVLGVVGPACSEAVKGANDVFGPAGIPFISFAATLDSFAGEDFGNFFRTVHSNSYQALAMAKVISAFRWKKVILFHTDEAYGNNLKDKIQLSATTVSEWIVRKVPYPPPKDTQEYIALFNDDNGNSLSGVFDDSTIAILAVTPNAAEGLWKAALAYNDKEYLKYPWWFFGTDGTTCVDLVEQAGDNLDNLTLTIQGQIGMAPYKGDYASRSPMLEFREFWAKQAYNEYPGLLTLPVKTRYTEPRPYVTNLIDAMWTFFFMVDKLLDIHHGQPITSAMFLECLKDVQTNCAVFKGTSGTVGFDADTGDRRLEFDAARYDFVNLVHMTWSEKSAIRATDSSVFEVDVSKMNRPGPIPDGVQGIVVPGPAESTSNDLPPGVQAAYGHDSSRDLPPQAAPMSGGAIAGVVFLVVIGLSAIGLGAWYFLKKRRSQSLDHHHQFVRML